MSTENTPALSNKHSVPFTNAPRATESSTALTDTDMTTVTGGFGIVDTLKMFHPKKPRE